MLWNIIT